MTSPVDYYFEESGQLEYLVNETWRPRIPVSKLGTVVTSPSLVIKRASDGIDVTSTWFIGGSLTVTGGFVESSTVITMLAKGEYEMTITYTVDGVLRKDRLVFQVDE